MNKDTQKNITILNQNGEPIKEIRSVWLKNLDSDTLSYFYHENGITFYVTLDLDTIEIGGVMIQDEK